MKYLKTYKKIFEKLINPIDKDYILPLIDLGFKLDYSKIGELNLNLKSDKNLTDEFRIEILNEYLTMIDRIKNDWDLIYYNISFFGDKNVSIHLERKIKNVLQEVEMTKEQKLAYDSILSAIGGDRSLTINSISDRQINFNLKKGEYSTISWIKIMNDGLVKLPILRGRKGSSFTDLPFTDEDVKWFKRILWLDDWKNSVKNSKEFSIIHRKSQEELREIYK